MPRMVVETARMLASKPLVPVAATDLPDGYTAMPFEQYSGIRAQPGGMIWAGENRGFAIEPLHRGFVFTNPVSLFTSSRTGRSAASATTAASSITAAARRRLSATSAFSGFRRLHLGNGRPYEVAIFQGATFFRALARGQNFGALRARPDAAARPRRAARNSRSSAPSGSSGRARQPTPS